MFEILVAVYVTSFILSASLLSWQYFFVRRQLESHHLLVLNQNLQKVNLFWSYTLSNFAPLEPESIEKDQQQAKRSLLMVGILCFASLIGLVLLTCVIFSMRYFVRPRRERAVFKSPLIEDSSLSPAIVQSLVTEYQSIY